MTDSTLSQSFMTKWFSSDIYRELRGELNSDTQEVLPGTYPLPSNRDRLFRTHGFRMLKTLFQNSHAIRLLNELDAPNCSYGSYQFINEYNPILPIHLDTSIGNYRLLDDRLGDHPVSGITWRGANLFAILLGGRLPSEAEWEICAAAGDPDNVYPWGHDTPSPQKANYGEYFGGTTAVASFPPNPWGLYDMAGNVEEWCLDWYYSRIEHPNDSLNQGLRLASREKVVKGGGWNKDERYLRCASYRRKWSRIGTVGIGMRVLWDRYPPI